MRSLGKIGGYLGLKGYFSKEVFDWLRIWRNGQLGKGQACDIRAMFFWDFVHLVKGGRFVKKNDLV